MADHRSEREERVEELSERGFALLREGEYEAALALAGELEELGYSAAFDIAGQAHGALGHPEKAVEVLERGVGLAPQAWLNWQLLGNMRSELGDHAGAGEAYARALGCPDVRTSWVRLNQGVLLNRQERFAEALDVLGRIDADADELRLPIAEARVHALLGLERPAEGLALGERALRESGFDTEAETALRLASTLERAKLESGTMASEVRGNALALLLHDHTHRDVLALVRDIDDRYSADSRYFRILVHGHPLEEADYAGFYIRYDVVADSPHAALEFVQELEELEGHGRLSIEESEDVEPRPDDPQGVYWRSVWDAYERDDE